MYARINYFSTALSASPVDHWLSLTMKAPIVVTEVIVHARVEIANEATSTQIYVGFGLTYDDPLNTACDGGKIDPSSNPEFTCNLEGVHIYVVRPMV